MNDETKEMQKDIQELEAKINDPALCQKIANAVKTNVPHEDGFSLDLNDPILETLDLLKNPTIEPVLRPDQILKVAFANQPDKKDARQLVLDLYQL